MLKTEQRGITCIPGHVPCCRCDHFSACNTTRASKRHATCLMRQLLIASHLLRHILPLCNAREDTLPSAHLRHQNRPMHATRRRVIGLLTHAALHGARQKSEAFRSINDQSMNPEGCLFVWLCLHLYHGTAIKEKAPQVPVTVLFVAAAA